MTIDNTETGARDSGPADLVRILLAILLPPLGVLFQVGLGAQFRIDILLTLLGYIPGIRACGLDYRQTLRRIPA